MTLHQPSILSFITNYAAGGIKLTKVCHKGKMHDEDNSTLIFHGRYNERCWNGLLLPIFPYESSWNTGLRAFLYFAGLMYCFMGVAIVSDVFMGAIEKITSETRKVYLPADEDGELEVIEVRVWNDTVANLTLMALGSSAPEILLSCIEIIGNNFEAGDLGPGTIVGSAAFNLLAITGVCIIAIPTGEGRTIRLIKVFFVTSTFSLFAYIWLLLILDVITPNVIDLWEAILTLMFFPLIILIAWWADHDWKWKLPPQVADKQQIKLNIDDSSAESVMDNLINKDGDVNKEGLAELCKGLRKSFPDISDTDAAVLAATTLIDTQPHSRLWYRIGACRDISGGQKIQPVLNGMLREVYDTINTLPGAPDLSALPPIMTEHEKALVEFNCASFAVPENIGEFNITVVRQGRMDNTVHVRVESFDGTAKSDSDYIPIDEQIVFDPYVSEHDVTVKIIDDNQWEPDEEFFLRLSLVDEGMDRKDVTLGNLSLMQIVILNDDTPGVLSFRKRVHLVKESCKVASIEVERSKGADGEVSVQWKTLDGSAKSPQHFQGGEGTLVFKHGETLRSIDIPIINDLDSEKDACFEVELFQPTGGTKIGKIQKIAVTITNDDECNSTLRRMLNLTMDMLQSMEVHHETYKAQLRAALTVNGGDVEGATGLDYFMHFATFAWKVLFALIPPPGYFGGWPCFFSSLLFIGFLTAIIGDMASIFGCIVGLKDTVTAITFVALGTSLPDLFASKTAAAQEKYADNAIGNVTGSNSVNVFLGLGLPWVLAAIYHLVKGDDFVVQSGSLGFSVLIYSTVAFIAIVLILVRRYVAFFEKAELGGPTVAKWGCGIFLFILWMVYIILSSLQAYEYFDPV